MHRRNGPQPHALPRTARVLAATSATGLAVATDRQLPNPLHIAIVVVACIGYVGMLIADKRWGGLRIGLVAVATVAPVVVALVVIPRFTGDVWSYAMYGRILGVHHLSPWTHAPAAFPHDSLLHLVGRTWRGTPSVYGPAFTAASATSASVLGAGALATRLFYQGLSAVALGGAGWLIWRRTRSAAAVAFLTVHPLVVMYLVNGGRNDILVGVALLAAVVLVSNNRPGAAGVVGALGALVKVTGVVGFVALVVTMVARGERQAARRTVIAAGAVFGAGYRSRGDDRALRADENGRRPLLQRFTLEPCCAPRLRPTQRSRRPRTARAPGAGRHHEARARTTPPLQLPRHSAC